MNDMQDMTEVEYRLYKMRRVAGGIFRRYGADEFADAVERGELDCCKEMTVAAFFVDPPAPHDEEFIAAWNEAAEKADARTGL